MQIFSLKKALFWIVMPTIFISGSFYGAYFYYSNSSKKRFLSPKYQISAIVQTGLEKEALKTSYLAELMELSCDEQVNLFLFDLKRAKEKLLMSPMIRQANVKRIRPNAIYVDYEIRKPIAILCDYENIGVDEEGFPLPLTPFFKIHSLPEIYLGLIKNSDEKELKWHQKIDGKELSSAFQLLNFLSQPPCSEAFRVRRIDISRAFSSSYGKREIVLLIEEDIVAGKEKNTLCIFPKILRLNPKDIQQQLSNYLNLQSKMRRDYYQQLFSKALPSETIIFQPKIIDFRVPDLAFVQGKE